MAALTASLTVALLSATTLAGCALSPANPSDTAAPSPSDHLLTAAASNPERSLLPSDASDLSGTKITSLIFSGLSYLDETGEIRNELAKSVTANRDCTEYDISIQDGKLFSDGTKLTAENFIRAWNDAARASNRRSSSGLFAPIEGFSATADRELTGLKWVSDTRFKVQLSRPTCDFPYRLTATAFVPLPDSAFDSNGNVTAGFKESPYGYGPYMLARENAWERGTQLTLLPNSRYDGPRQAQNQGITFKFYNDLDRAYQDLLAGVLDVDDILPASDPVDSVDPEAVEAPNTGKPPQVPEDPEAITDALGERAAVASSWHLKSLAIPSAGHFVQGSEEGKLRRAAISQAFDRQAIVKQYFDTTRIQATDFLSPAAPGHSDKVAGHEVLTYRPDEARRLWAAANEISPWGEGETFTIARPSNGLNEWIDKALESIGSTLGIPTAGKPYLDQCAIDLAVSRGDIASAYLVDWQSPYFGTGPSLFPLFTTGGYANRFGYSSAELDTTLAKAGATPDPNQATRLYQQAQVTLLRDLPLIPLWHANSLVGWAPGIGDVSLDWRGVPQYWRITKP